MKNMIKQDLNFLDHPMWFQVSKASQDKMVWEDGEGYTYRAAYRAPDQLDMLFLLYILMRSQQQNYAARLEFSRYEILKGCGCPINPQYLRRLEDSLKRWLNVSIEFTGSFFDGVQYTSTGFHILENYQIREVDRKLEISLSPSFLRQTKQSSFFKYLNFSYYKVLRRPVSRRLFELLTKTFKTQPQWKIPLVDLGRKLTLYTRKKKTKRGEEEVIYPSDVLTAVKSAVTEINKLATNAQVLREIGIDPKEVYAVTYELLEPDKKVVVFTRAPLTHLYDELIDDPQATAEAEAGEPRLEELVAYLKRASKPLREVVERYYKSHGYDYVKWNIFYANRNGSKNYASYLKLCLQHNWAQELREEYERMFNTEETAIDPRKIAALVKVAEQADYLVLPDGKRFRIRRVFPNGAIEIVNKAYKMDFVISPAQAYGCRFETESESKKA
jgi:hypothetical protein